MGLKAKFWGTRGSIPAPHAPDYTTTRITQLLERFFKQGHTKADEIPQFLKQVDKSELGGYGGNTPCVEIFNNTDQVVIDGGSGIRALGQKMMGGPCGLGRGEVHIFFTHFHWDHLIGLPFFIPLFVPGNKIHMYSVQDYLPTAIQTIFRRPYFPVEYEKLPTKIEYHLLEPRHPHRHGSLTLTPYQLDHPDPCWGYRIESQGKSLAYCVDTEGLRVSRQELDKDLPLYLGADAMIFDAQYTLLEATERVNWGHAAATIGLDIAMREGIKQVAFMHFDPSASEEKIAEAESQTRSYCEAALGSASRAGSKVYEVHWYFAQERMVLSV